MPIINNSTIKLSLDSSCHTLYSLSEYEKANIQTVTENLHYLRSFPDIALRFATEHNISGMINAHKLKNGDLNTAEPCH